jgi:hypothetical protein
MNKVYTNIGIINIIVVSIFSIIVFPGSPVLIGDQQLYVPGIFKSLDPELYSSGMYTLWSSMNSTLFDEFMASIIRITDLNIFSVIFLVSFILRFIQYYSMYKIAQFFTKNDVYSFLFTFSFVFYPAYLTGFNHYLVPRLISITLLLCFFALYIYRKRLLAAIALGSAILMNPINTASFCLFFFVSTIYSIHKKGKTDIRHILYLFIPVLFFVGLLYTSKGVNVELFSHIDPEWLEIMRLRSVDDYIARYSISSLISLQAPYLFSFIIFFLIIRLESNIIFLDSKRKEYFYTFLIINIILFLIFFIAIGVFSMDYLGKFQINRGFFIGRLMIIMLFFFYAFNYILNNPKDLLFNFSMIGIGFCFILQYYLKVSLFLFIPTFAFIYLTKKYGLPKKLKNLDVKKSSLVIYFFSLLIIGVGVTIYIKYFTSRSIIHFLSVLFSLNLLSLMVILTSNKMRGKTQIPINAIIILLIVLIVIKYPKFTIYPKSFDDKPLVEAMSWIKENTSKNSLFLGEPFSKQSQNIRMLGLRPLFTTYKEGGVSAFNREHAIEWKKRIEIIDKVDTNYKLLEIVSKNYGVDYIFSDSKLTLNYPLVYNNSNYFIYRINNNEI